MIDCDRSADAADEADTRLNPPLLSALRHVKLLMKLFRNCNNAIRREVVLSLPVRKLVINR